MLDDLRVLAVPDTRLFADLERHADCGRQLDRFAVARSFEDGLQLLEASAGAFLLELIELECADVERRLMVDGGAEIARRAFPAQSFHQLLGGERNQHAEHDDSHLANERAPAVQRFGKLKMHRALAPEPDWYRLQVRGEALGD